MQKTYLISLTFLLVSLMACSNDSPLEQNGASNSNDKSQEVNVTEHEKPPSLTITFGEEVVKAIQGGYSWSYLDSTTREVISVETESLSPTELTNIENAVSVNLRKPVTLHIEKEPLNYEIRVYDNNDNIIATYNDFKNVKEKGKAIYEILVTWEEGTGIYAVALDVH